MKKAWTTFDFFLLLGLAVLLMGFFLLRPHEKGDIVCIEQNGKPLYEIPFCSLNSPSVYFVGGDYPLEITVDHDGAYVSSCSCANHSCKNTGRISKEGEIICCLPAKCTVRICSHSGSGSSLPDAYTG